MTTGAKLDFWCFQKTANVYCSDKDKQGRCEQAIYELEGGCNECAEGFHIVQSDEGETECRQNLDDNFWYREGLFDIIDGNLHRKRD